jgi:hypothetical protein
MTTRDNISKLGEGTRFGHVNNLGKNIFPSTWYTRTTVDGND